MSAPVSGWADPRALLRRYGLDAKKGWGQNFLVDPSVPGRIAAALGAAAGETVVEIGAGLGHLTAALAHAGARVVAIERDRDLVPVLRAEFALVPAVEVAEANALTYDLATAAAAAGRRVLLAGNLPYHLTGPLLGKLLADRAHIARFAVMVQREVADRLAAPPGSRTYGALSVRFALHCEHLDRFAVPRGAFHPVPGVDSAVVHGSFLPAPREPVGDVERFDRLVRFGFGQRRKTLRNALKPLLAAHTAAVLARAGVDGDVRAEKLGVAQYAALTRAWLAEDP
ncbi:MAG TPA: 16S rRNA (adenine(1518)-N(6)/adenine(1519)-N(6))-dimethyltransferase RsmA [Myxococcota bacterium]|jgi:16S rRNA (adenine1518-N6/adenine1519-N6)-dimethyltransferase|nr:16S rRNA (adenine(1518)-N(6)/adenine(1519)-N(6))-dimethyltransferase RsmA [Myxococcota bacterium]